LLLHVAGVLCIVFCILKHRFVRSDRCLQDKYWQPRLLCVQR
jgi:hypothetical protein